jgi:hypothetical protein
MPYALFSNDAKLSKAYPTEADVWKLARQSGLVVDAATEEEKAAPRPVLDNDYEIRPCRPGIHRRIPPRTRPTPSARPNWNFSWVREGKEASIQPSTAVIPGRASANLRCAIAHRGLSRSGSGPLQVGYRRLGDDHPGMTKWERAPTASPPPAMPARRRASRRLSCGAGP